MPTEAKWKPDKAKEYREFLLWLSLPSFLFKLPQDKLDLMNLDEEILALLEYKTQGELAEFLKVDQGTLSDWKNKEVPDEYKDIDWRVWAKRLTKNVVGALYRQSLIDGDAARAKFWFQVVEGWKEGFEIDQNVRGEIEDMRNQYKDLILDERSKAKSDNDEPVVQGEQPAGDSDGGSA